MSRFTPSSTPVHFNVASRYKDTKIIRRATTGVRELGLWSADRSFSRAQDFALHQITDFDKGRLDLISFRYYGTVDYWWVIADANDMIHPLREMEVGSYIRIPSRSLIDAYVRRGPVKA